MSDEELAQLSARESSTGPATSELLRRFQPRVWRICFRLLSHEQDASDAAQEVLLRLFLHRDRFAGMSKYSTWVYGVAVRTCLTIRRGRGRRQRHEMTSDSEGLWAETSGKSNEPTGVAIDLQQMLEILEDEDRALMIMKYSEGHSHEELAEIFEMSESACKMRLSRAKEKIQSRFGEKGSG